jgi:hypothetical protein
MSLDKAIASGKERRKGYQERGLSGEFDKTCRPHGGGTSIPCPWCENNRAFKLTRLMVQAKDEMRDYQYQASHPDFS